MALIGYARVSTSDQDLGVQEDALRDAGCERIFKEKASGRSTDRPEWAECLEFLREGDILVFTRLDRVGRSLVDLVNIGAALQERGVGIKCLFQSVDTSSSEGRLMWGVLAVVAEFEVDLKRERQKEGIQRAKAEGRGYKGRKRKATKGQIRKLLAQGLGATAIARELGCDRSAVYRAHPEGWGEAPMGE